MNKMTDEERDDMYEIINTQKLEMVGCGYSAQNKRLYMIGISDARDFYDAQIDAQAKTMEELISLFKVNQSNEVSQKEYEFIMRCLKNYPNESPNAIANFISGFLAAGGVIKE